jgi:DNA polymerase I-like protein with 3'-5' exonuclease and polymerase domains
MKYVALDIETTGLQFWKDTILGVGLYAGEKAQRFYRWDTEREAFERQLDKLVKAGYGIVTHSGGFDWLFLKQQGISFDINFDTKIGVPLLEDRPATAELGSLASYFLKMPSWKSDVSRKNLQHEDLERVADYCLLDCKATFELAPLLVSKLEANQQKEFYFTKLLPLYKLLLTATFRGIKLDVPTLRDQLQRYETDVDNLYSKLRTDFSEIIKPFEEFQLKVALSEKKTDKSKAKILSKPPQINFRGNKQLLTLLRDYAQLDVRDRDGKPSVSDEALFFAADHPLVMGILKCRETAKPVEFFKSWLELKDGNDIIHTTFNVDVARTGRLSCIAKGQLVSVPGGEVPIERIKKGDYVYSIKQDQTVGISKVIRTIDNGYRNCVEVKWQSSGSGDVGSLVCTADHKILHKYKGWVEAKDLVHYDKVVHLRRRLQANGRFRVYSVNKAMELEEQVIKREFFGAPGFLHIHHINKDKKDNTLSNLAVVTPKAHVGFHPHPPDHPIPYRPSYKIAPRPTKLFSRIHGLRILATVRGRVTKLPGDFNTFKKKFRLLGIDIKTVQKRYSSSGIYLSRGNVLKALSAGTIQESAKALGIGTRKLQDLLKQYGYDYNHTILSVKPVGLRHVFDLEVEGTHNFIVNEITVHNCSEPNMQQIPVRRDPTIRHNFIPRGGHKLVVFDLSNIEPRFIAHYSKDKDLMDIYQRGLSLYGVSANKIGIYEGDPNELKAKDKHLYNVAKTIVLAMFYNMGARKLAFQLRKDAGANYTEKQCRAFITKFFAGFPGIADLKNQVERAVSKRGYVKNFFGRHVFVSREKAYMQALNSLIQSSASDYMCFLQLELRKALPDTCNLLLLVHDEMIWEVPTEKADEVAQTILDINRRFWQNLNVRVPIELEGGVYSAWGKK